MINLKNYDQLVRLLRTKELTISTAESCTGGLIAAYITDIPGSSKVFLGGVVSYSNTMKRKWLNVKLETLEQYGAVSQNTVEEMLDGILNVTGSDIAVAVSGIAGPGGGTDEKPVGTVFIGVAYNTKKVIHRCSFTGSRKKVRQRSADKILEVISEMLSE